MSFKYVLFYIGCAVTWMVLLPVLVVSGGIALMTYAVFSELGTLFKSSDHKSLDDTTAREIARRMCVGH
jgi:hypothetical protein